MSDNSNEQLTISINKICDALRNTKVTQTYGTLYSPTTGNKCALGVLSCEYYKDLTQNQLTYGEYDYIIKACGVPDKYVEEFLPADCLERPNCTDGYLSFANIIIRLNDFYELPFNIIADYLETSLIPEDDT